MHGNGCRPLGRHFYLLAAILLLAAGVRAADNPPATTLIHDIIYHANGTPARGTMVISWPAFETLDHKTVAAGVISVQLGATGELNVSLAPNQGATPLGTYYRVITKLDDGTTTTEYWNVPNISPATVASVRTTLQPGNPQQPTQNFVQQAEVSVQPLPNKIPRADASGWLQDGWMTGLMHLAGAETVTGAKTFSAPVNTARLNGIFVADPSDPGRSITAMDAATGGIGTVDIPSGAYNLSSTIDSHHGEIAYVTWRGASQKGTTLNWSGAGTAINFVGNYNGTIEDFNLNQTGTPGTGTGIANTLDHGTGCGGAPVWRNLSITGFEIGLSMNSPQGGACDSVLEGISVAENAVGIDVASGPTPGALSYDLRMFEAAYNTSCALRSAASETLVHGGDSTNNQIDFCFPFAANGNHGIVGVHGYYSESNGSYGPSVRFGTSNVTDDDNTGLIGSLQDFTWIWPGTGGGAPLVDFNRAGKYTLDRVLAQGGALRLAGKASGNSYLSIRNAVVPAVNHASGNWVVRTEGSGNHAANTNSEIPDKLSVYLNANPGVERVVYSFNWASSDPAEPFKFDHLQVTNDLDVLGTVHIEGALTATQDILTGLAESQGIHTNASSSQAIFNAISVLGNLNYSQTWTSYGGLLDVVGTLTDDAGVSLVGMNVRPELFPTNGNAGAGALFDATVHVPSGGNFSLAASVWARIPTVAGTPATPVAAFLEDNPGATPGYSIWVQSPARFGGAVGIGKIASLATLDVNGGAAFSGTVSASSFSGALNAGDVSSGTLSRARGGTGADTSALPAGCVQYPCRMAGTTLTNQNAGINPTVIYTAAAEGNYQLCMSERTTTAGTAGNLGLYMLVNNGAGNSPATSMAISNNPDLSSLTGNGGGCRTSRVAANGTISYQTVFFAVTGSPVYTLGVDVFRLN